jgi:hypothetical protein
MLNRKMAPVDIPIYVVLISYALFYSDRHCSSNGSRHRLNQLNGRLACLHLLAMHASSNCGTAWRLYDVTDDLGLLCNIEHFQG